MKHLKTYSDLLCFASLLANQITESFGFRQGISCNPIGQLDSSLLPSLVTDLQNRMREIETVTMWISNTTHMITLLLYNYLVNKHRAKSESVMLQVSCYNLHTILHAMQCYNNADTLEG